MSNTTAVSSCERSRPAIECNELRSSELERIRAYIEDGYEESITTSLAVAMVMSEEFDVLIARRDGKVFEPAAGRPFTPIGDVPPLRSARLAQEARDREAASEMLSAATAVVSGLGSGSAAPPSSGGEGATFRGLGDQGGTPCKPIEIKPVTAESCPY